jgi:hypothetical protein
MDRSMRRFVVIGLVVSALVAVVVSQFASGNPDGLEFVAEQEGFAEAAEDHDLADSPLADYGARLTDSPVINTAVAGLIGVLVTLAVGWLVFRVARKPGRQPQ